MMTVFPASHRDTLTLLDRLANLARAHTLGHFRTAPETVSKTDSGDYDPVTVADRAAEQAIRAHLNEVRSADTIIGEEFGETPGQSGWTWYLDPIDGTRAYVAGLASWTTLIGLADADGVPVYGLIDCPVLDETYFGWPGGAACRRHGDWSQCAVSDCADLSESRIATTDPFIFAPDETPAWTGLRTAARIARYGLDAYAYARLADGTLDLVAESGLKPWDAAALIPVVRGAGGLATNWRGQAATAEGGQLVCAAHQSLLDQALEMLGPAGL